MSSEKQIMNFPPEQAPYRVMYDKKHGEWIVFGPFEKYHYNERFPYNKKTARLSAYQTAARLNAEYIKEHQ